MNLQECRVLVAKTLNTYVEKYGPSEPKTKAEIRQILGDLPLHVMFLESDMCYNKTNKANLKTYPDDIIVFENTGRGMYRILGENYPYSGDVIWKNKTGKEVIVGRWNEGVLDYWGLNK